MPSENLALEKLPSGIAGFDTISNGGLPKGRTTIVAGTVGSGKTVFAAQFLAEGITQWDEPAVFVTFEESPEEIRRDMASLGWDIARWENEGKWTFVDASVRSGETVIIGKFDLRALMMRIQHAVKKIGASRISLDSVGAVVSQLGDEAGIRREIFWILSVLRDMNVTGVITADRGNDEYGAITTLGLEAVVADNVLILRNPLEEMTRRRTIEIVKFRGTTHQRREFPFTVVSGKGIVIVPFTSIELTQPGPMPRISSGIKGLDPLCGGGFFRNSITMITGPSGSGKTVMTTQFLAAGCAAGERGILMAFEENRAQLCRNALNWGVDLESAEKAGLLRMVCHYPEEATLEDTLAAIKLAVEEYQPQRLGLDSLSSLERIAHPRSFRAFVTGLTSLTKQHGVTTVVTNTSTALVGGSFVAEPHISTLTDAIVLLRYLELNGRILRAMSVLKIRGSAHDTNVNEYRITNRGAAIGRPFRNVAGILSGDARPVDMSRYEFLESEAESEE